jgi:hypothetical protein
VDQRPIEPPIARLGTSYGKVRIPLFASTSSMSAWLTFLLRQQNQ